MHGFWRPESSGRMLVDAAADSLLKIRLRLIRCVGA